MRERERERESSFWVLIVWSIEGTQYKRKQNFERAKDSAVELPHRQVLLPKCPNVGAGAFAPIFAQKYVTLSTKCRYSVLVLLFACSPEFAAQNGKKETEKIPLRQRSFPYLLFKIKTGPGINIKIHGAQRIHTHPYDTTLESSFTFQWFTLIRLLDFGTHMIQYHNPW